MTLAATYRVAHLRQCEVKKDAMSVAAAADAGAVVVAAVAVVKGARVIVSTPMARA